ncbi:hypothetical protein [Flavobacterium soyangense]|nr:hypothetical protein [Flavobacterium soyangense]
MVILSYIGDEEGKSIAKKLNINAEYLHLDVGDEENWLTAA